MGGRGARRTPRLAARFADEFNMSFASVADTATQFTRVSQACRDTGRDPAELVWSVALTAVVGRDDAEVTRRAEAIGRDPGELRANGLCGSPAEVVDRLGEWRQATGIRRVYLQLLDIGDLDHAELVAAEVAPQVAAGPSAA
jgi:alkanesulfonate monooxygenase SsuD/methylene tetrahydromethanopterin reductase-like flavin-dependent oxidoreductase (luciferase family)